MPISLPTTNHSPKPYSSGEVRASALHSSKTPAFLIGRDGGVVSFTCTSLVWEQVLAGEEGREVDMRTTGGRLGRC